MISKRRKKICFKVPCSHVEMEKYRVLGENVLGEKWLSTPIVSTKKERYAICTPEGCVPLAPRRSERQDYSRRADRPARRKSRRSRREDKTVRSPKGIHWADYSLPRNFRENETARIPNADYSRFPGDNNIVSTSNAIYSIPVEIPSVVPESQKKCEGSCCLWYFGMCGRPQEAWRRSLILFFELLVLLFHLWILVGILTCCGCWCCRTERIMIDAQEVDIHSVIANATKAHHTHRTPLNSALSSMTVAVPQMASFVEQNRPVNPSGFKGLMTVEIPAHTANAPRESPEIIIESGSSSEDESSTTV